MVRISKSTVQFSQSSSSTLNFREVVRVIGSFKLFECFELVGLFIVGSICCIQSFQQEKIGYDLTKPAVVVVVVWGGLCLVWPGLAVYFNARIHHHTAHKRL